MLHTLAVWAGPPASEKTTGALKRARRMLRQGFDIPFVVRPAKSVRDHERDPDCPDAPVEFLITQGGERYPSLQITDARELEDVVQGWGGFWLDEPNLLDNEDLVPGIIRRCRASMPVIVSGCPATSEIEEFGCCMGRLMQVADHVHWRKADCDDCGHLHAASRAFFLLGKKTQQIVVGGKEAYRSLCPNCWNKRTDDG